MWLNLIGNQKLFSLDPVRVYKNYRVCHSHFRPEDKSSNMYLICSTLPSQNLPQIENLEMAPGTSKILNVEEIPSTSTTVEMPTTSSGILNIEEMPTTSSEILNSLP
ncbi:uncharacterized protein LOC113464519, partial [Ceratina calcarata]|uniref:Uncharacterized protein LOC113464519 n=1 Tax=Ceratina calcarata TaxID=156304 RepID=A0AAJ7S377_9HYME